MSSLAPRIVLLSVLLSVCSVYAQQYQAVGPSLNPAPVLASQVAKLSGLTSDIRRRWENLDASCDARAVFALTYLNLAEGMAKSIKNNYFDDGNSMADFVINLASKYTSASDAWAEGNAAQVSNAWAEAFSWTVYGDSNATEDLLLGLNAHMTYDLAIATFESKFNAPSRKADYDRVNDQIQIVLYNISIALVERYDSNMVPRTFEGGLVDYLLPKIVAWRSSAMKSAIMFSLAQTEKQLSVFVKGCENAATLTAYNFQLAKANTAEERLSYCKENHPESRSRKLAAALAAAAAAAPAPASLPKAQEEEEVAAPPDMSAKQGLPDVAIGGFPSLLAALKV